MFVIVCMINIIHWMDVVLAIQEKEIQTLANLKKIRHLQLIHYEMIQEAKYFLSLKDEEYNGSYLINVDNDCLFIKNLENSIEINVKIVENEVFEYSSH